MYIYQNYKLLTNKNENNLDLNKGNLNEINQNDSFQNFKSEKGLKYKFKFKWFKYQFKWFKY